MNAKQLTKDVGRMFRLRPRPRLVQRSFLPSPFVLTSGEPVLKGRQVEVDYDWRLDAVTDDGVTLVCPFLGHTVTLGADNVREYRTPNFLLLKCQLILDGGKVRIEPF